MVAPLLHIGQPVTSMKLPRPAHRNLHQRPVLRRSLESALQNMASVADMQGVANFAGYVTGKAGIDRVDQSRCARLRQPGRAGQRARPRADSHPPPARSRGAGAALGRAGHTDAPRRPGRRGRGRSGVTVLRCLLLHHRGHPAHRRRPVRRRQTPTHVSSRRAHGRPGPFRQHVLMPRQPPTPPGPQPGRTARRAPPPSWPAGGRDKGFQGRVSPTSCQRMAAWSASSSIKSRGCFPLPARGPLVSAGRARGTPKANGVGAPAAGV